MYVQLSFFFYVTKKQSQEFNIFKALIAPQGAGKLLGKWKKSGRSCSYTANIYRMVIGNFIGNPLSA